MWPPPSTSLSCPPVTTRQCKRVSTCVMAKPRAVPKCFSCKMHAPCVCVSVCFLHCLECFTVGRLDRQLSVGSSGGCSLCLVTVTKPAVWPRYPIAQLRGMPGTHSFHPRCCPLLLLLPSEGVTVEGEKTGICNKMLEMLEVRHLYSIVQNVWHLLLKMSNMLLVNPGEPMAGCV